MDSWTYVDVDAARRQRLSRFGSFAALCVQVTAEARCTFAQWERGSGQPHGVPTHCGRPVYEVHLDETGDALYNGPHGLRAAYWKAPEVGDAANSQLLAALRPALLAVTPAAHKSDAARALQCPWAKLWLHEQRQARNGHSQLAVARWVLAAQSEAKQYPYGDHDDAARGIEAEHFLVMGAWYGKGGMPFLTTDKAQRAADIHANGAS